MSEVMSRIQKLRMKRWDARAAFKEYAAACKLHPEMSEYKELADAYGVLARGGEILQLEQALQAGGLYADGLPRLAVVRADGKDVQYWRGCRDRWDNGSARGHHFLMGNSRAGVRGKRKGIMVDMGVLQNGDRIRQHVVYRAVAPLVPPRFLPQSGLHNYYLLWEATWERVTPIDPILMRHVSGSFFQVLYQWDLTDLERMALSTRLANLGNNVPVGGSNG